MTAGSARLPDQGCKEAALGRRTISVHLLGMPLHRQKPGRVAGGFNCFNQLIVGPTGGTKANRQILDRLVVGRIHRDRRVAPSLAGPAAGIQPDPVASPVTGAVWSVVDCSGVLAGQVLKQGAAQAYVDELNASTDAEDRQAPLSGYGKQRKLEEIALAARRAQQRRRIGAVPCRIQVLST